MGNICVGTVKYSCETYGLAEQGPGADCLQRPLVPRSRFRQQLRPGVGPPTDIKLIPVTAL